MVRAAAGLGVPVAAVERAPKQAPRDPLVSAWLLDDPRGEGPLAGISAALAWAGEGRVLVLAGDLPLLTTEVLARLVALHPDARAVAPRVGEHLHPLCAVYDASLAAVAGALLARGARAAYRLFREAEGLEVSAEVLGVPARVALALAGVNTPEALAEALAAEDSP